MNLFITTTNPIRAALWRHLFGENLLPVLQREPIASRCGGESYYLVDTDRLRPQQQQMLAGYLARTQFGVSIEDAWSTVKGLVKIPANDCVIIERPLEEEAAASSLLDRFLSSYIHAKSPSSTLVSMLVNVGS